MKFLKNLPSKRNRNGNYVSYAIFLCLICNTEIIRQLSVGKKQKSCGCNKNKTHGESKTKLYCVWKAIKNRCFNPKTKQFKDYGGRGIIICPEWTNDYAKFRDWALSNGYVEGLQINRINNNGNYEPHNCNFVTTAKNAQNRNNNVVTMQLANTIRTLYKTGNYTHRQLAKKFGIGGISDIINNKSWTKQGDYYGQK